MGSRDFRRRATETVISTTLLLLFVACGKSRTTSAQFEAKPGAPSVPGGGGKGVAFASLGFSDALERAKSERKLVMVDVYTDWCGWCKKLERETFADPRVGAATRDLVSIRVNAEKGGERVAERYRVEGFPVIIFVDGSGNEVQRITGYVDADEMLKVVEGLPRRSA